MRHSKRTTLPIGTISSGTLRLKDLIPSLAYDLDQLRLSRAERKTVREALAADVESAADDADNIGPIYLDHLYEELTTIAESHTPDYAYFGSLEGDGAEIGVWPSLEDTDDLPRGESYQDAPNDATHFLEVNDHGNATLYRRAGRRWLEVWSVV